MALYTQNDGDVCGMAWNLSLLCHVIYKEWHGMEWAAQVYGMQWNK